MNKTSNTLIGIFDSGLGGLSVWSEVVRLMPNQSTIYYADRLNCPYGGKNSEEIYDLTEKGVKWLIKNGANVIIIACNTATGAAIEKLRTKYKEYPFIGIEPAIKKAVEITKTGIIGILATKFTLHSKKYLNTKDKYAKECKVIEQAGEGLVELVESNDIECEKASYLLDKYILPMMSEGIDTIVLGCTHYPFFTNKIKKITDNKISIINPAPYVVKHTIEVMKEKQIEQDNRRIYRFHSTLSVQHSLYIRKRALEILQNGHTEKDTEEDNK